MKYIIRFPKGVYHKNKYKFKKRISAFGFKWERIPGGDYTDGKWVGERGIVTPEYPDGSGGRAFIFIETKDQDFINIIQLFCGEANVVLEEYEEVKIKESLSDEECKQLWRRLMNEWQDARSWRNWDKEQKLFKQMAEFDDKCRSDYVCGCKEWPSGETVMCLLHEGENIGNIK